MGIEIKYRNPVFDMVKGIGIILMIYYHLSSDLRPLIFSFHMPLFFLLSGYFMKPNVKFSDFFKITWKNARRLLLPYFVTVLILILVGLFKYWFTGSSDSIFENLQRLCWSGADIKYTDYGLISLGPLWFLVALFWAKEFFVLIHTIVNKYIEGTKALWIILGVCAVLSFLSTYIFPKVDSIPLSLFQGVEALVFVAIGYCAKQKVFPKWAYFAAAVIWPVAIVLGGVDMMFCYLKIFPLSVIGACGGTYIMYLLCKWFLNLVEARFQKAVFIPTCLSWFGRCSLALLCMHSIDMLSDTYLKVANSLPVSFSEWGLMAFRFGFAVALAWIVVKLPVLKKVYS